MQNHPVPQSQAGPTDCRLLKVSGFSNWLCMVLHDIITGAQFCYLLAELHCTMHLCVCAPYGKAMATNLHHQRCKLILWDFLDICVRFWQIRGVILASEPAVGRRTVISSNIKLSKWIPFLLLRLRNCHTGCLQILFLACFGWTKAKVK